MGIIKGQFDVQIDSNHRWDTDRMMEIDAYAMNQDDDGVITTDTQSTIASIRIHTPKEVCMDVWIDTTQTDAINDLPPIVRVAYDAVVSLGTALQNEHEERKHIHETTIGHLGYAPSTALKSEYVGKVVDVQIWQRDIKGVIAGSPDTYAGTLEAFWHRDENIVVKLQGLDRIQIPAGAFRVEVSLR